MENLPLRTGVRPTTTPSNPHMQLNQQPTDMKHIEELQNWAFSLPHINKENSRISVPGAQAMCLAYDNTCKECNAFMIGTEFAHFHPHPDYSLHLGLTLNDTQTVIDKGWGELHPVVHKGWLPANFIMLYAARNEEEVTISKLIIQQSYDFAAGKISD